jgi:uncharacterized protein YcfL
MKTKLIHLMNAGAVAASLAVIVGCSTQSVNTVENANPAATRAMVTDKRIITDSSLNKAVHVVGVNEVPGEFRKVQVELLNTTSSVKSFSYLFEWFDRDGMLVSTPTASFVPRQIEGGESLFISGVAPKPDAKDFRLKLIENVR